MFEKSKQYEKSLKVRVGKTITSSIRLGGN